MTTVGPWNRKWPEAADALRGRIQDGALEPGTAVPLRQLFPELGARRMAVSRALSALEDEGLVERRPGVGYIVTARSVAVPGPSG